MIFLNIVSNYFQTKFQQFLDLLLIKLEYWDREKCQLNVEATDMCSQLDREFVGGSDET